MADNKNASPESITPMMSSGKNESESKNGSSWIDILSLVLIAATAIIAIVTLISVKGLSPAGTPDVAASTTAAASSAKAIATEIPMSAEAGSMIHEGENVCVNKKPYHANAAGDDNYFKNTECMKDNVVQVLEQAGANITVGFVGGMDAGNRFPMTEPYWKEGLCPVNVHWHLGAEHLSVGEFDEAGSGPAESKMRKLLAGSDVREGFRCHHYDASDAKFTTEYEWKHCKDMHVGNTYEVHWPHSAAGACGTPNQYQTPFYDGVFCTDGIISLDPLNTYQKIGVQGQVFTIVNDEAYYYPDLIRGMIVDGEMGQDISKYTGSTTGTSRSNTMCSMYTPITWQVDRKCHMISASSFDKMCADMKAQRDDMTDDLHPHGARELVAEHLSANNMVP